MYHRVPPRPSKVLLGRWFAQRSSPLAGRWLELATLGSPSGAEFVASPHKTVDSPYSPCCRRPDDKVMGSPRTQTAYTKTVTQIESPRGPGWVALGFCVTAGTLAQRSCSGPRLSHRESGKGSHDRWTV